MKQIKLDPTDIIILKALQEDGRATNVDIAHQAEFSALPNCGAYAALKKTALPKAIMLWLTTKSFGYEMFVLCMSALSIIRQKTQKIF